MEHLNELVLLLPGHELDGFPRALAGDQAAPLLSGWVALWHPTLLCGVGKIPRWHQASRLPSQLDAVLFVLPPHSASALEADGAERIEAAGGLLLQPSPSWRDFQAKVLGHFPQVQPNELAENLANEFAALGYGYLQVQLMTRQLRYTSNLDIALFEEQVLRATEAVLANDRSQAEILLQACFDTLGQERDHYYSSDAHLIDLTLLAETTLGKSLERQLDDPQPTTFIASAEMLQRLKDRSESNMSRLRQRLADKNVCLAGGLETENASPLVPVEHAERMLRRASEVYRRLGVEPPRVFARLNYGIWPDAVSLLKQFDFLGAILVTASGERYPTSGQSKISWEGSEGCRLPALAIEPLDAADANTYLAFGLTIGELLDKQHVPTVVLAHWPSTGCEFHQLLSIFTSHTPALGKWRLADDYFENTEEAFHQQRFDTGLFKHDWLSKTQSPNELILETKRVFETSVRDASLLNMANLVWQLRRMKEQGDWNKDVASENTPPNYRAMEATELGVEVAGDGRQDGCPAVLEQLAGLMTSGNNEPSSSRIGRVLFNPRSSPARVAVRTAVDETFDTSQRWHFATGVETRMQEGMSRLTCIDVPGMGFVASPMKPPVSGKPEKVHLADADGVLRNEFVEVQIDRQRGTLRSLQVPSVRGNRLSAMVVYREKVGSTERFSEINLKSMTLLMASNMSGLVRAKGNLVFRGKSIGEFEIDYEIQRGSRILVANIALSNLVYPMPLPRGKKSMSQTARPTPWQSAFVLRWAWNSEAANLRTYFGNHRNSWTEARAIAPELIEIDEVDRRTYLLTGGLAFHRREDVRFAETILAVPGMESTEHRIGFGVDLPHPLAAAMQFMDQPYEVLVDRVPQSTSGWLAHVDTKNVVVNLLSPLVDSQGKNVGMRVSMVEMGGTATTARVRWFRDVAKAHRVDFSSEAKTPLSSEGDAVTVSLRAGEQAFVDLLWSFADDLTIPAK